MLPERVRAEHQHNNNRDHRERDSRPSPRHPSIVSADATPGADSNSIERPTLAALTDERRGGLGEPQCLEERIVTAAGRYSRDDGLLGDGGEFASPVAAGSAVPKSETKR